MVDTNMKLSEIAEYVVEKYPDCYMATNGVVCKGNREDWCEEYLIDELMNFFSYEVMDLCGCGRPEDTHEVIRQILTIRYERFVNDTSYDQVEKMYGDNLHLDMKDPIHQGIVQFILYILDFYDILSHGCSIGGCWLTDLGKMYLTVLNAWYARENTDNNGGEHNETV